MAATNTTSITRAPKGAKPGPFSEADEIAALREETTVLAEALERAEGINLSAINPLLITCPGALKSTATNVSAVLSLLSLAFRNADPNGDFIMEGRHAIGLSLILDTCSSALEQAQQQEGGAA